MLLDTTETNLESLVAVKKTRLSLGFRRKILQFPTKQSCAQRRSSQAGIFNFVGLNTNLLPRKTSLPNDFERIPRDPNLLLLLTIFQNGCQKLVMLVTFSASMELRFQEKWTRVFQRNLLEVAICVLLQKFVGSPLTDPRATTSWCRFSFFLAVPGGAILQRRQVDWKHRLHHPDGEFWGATLSWVTETNLQRVFFLFYTLQTGN